MVTVEMLSLDKPVYKYWSNLRIGGGAGDGNTVSPANPQTNILGWALGYSVRIPSGGNDNIPVDYRVQVLNF